MKHPQSKADHLQVLAAGSGTDIPRLGSDIIDDAFLKPRNEKMCAFVDDLLFHSRQTIEDDRPRTTFDIVHCGIAERYSCANRNCQFRDGIQRTGHDGETGLKG